MGFIMDLFAPKPPSTKRKNKFSENTTKLVGVPLTTVYGRANLKGNQVYNQLSDDQTEITQIIALCWGPVNPELETLRVNEKRPHYINDELNPDRKKSPGYIKDVKVWVYDGTLGQTMPEFDEIYQCNRTCSVLVKAKANDDLSSINDFSMTVERPTLFTNVGYSGDYNTPIPTAISNVFPNGTPSNNPIAAALDYLLNRDYGSATIQNDYGDFATWVSGIGHCSVPVNSADSTTVPWPLIDGFKITSKNTLEKSSGQRNWNCHAYSSVGASSYSPTFNVTFKPKSIGRGGYDKQVRVCELIDKHNQICEDTTEFVSSSTISIAGIATSDTRSDPLYYQHSFRMLEGRALAIFENNIQKATAGTFTSDTELKIDWDGTEVKYYKDNVLVYTSIEPVGSKEYISIAAYEPEASIEISEFNESDGELRHTFNDEIGTNEDDDHIDTIEDIMKVAHAAPFQSNGTIKCWYAHPKAPVMHLDRSVFEVKGAELMDTSKTPNVVEIKYKDPDEDSEKRTATWENVSSISEWKEIREEIQVDGISTRNQASRYASFIGRRAIAEPLKVKGEADQRYYVLEPGDVVTLTYGSVDTTWFENKKFWVDEIKPDNKDGDVDLVLLEYGGDTLFDDSAATNVEVNDPVFVKDETIAMPSPGSIPISPTISGHKIGIIEKKPTKLFYCDLEIVPPNEPSFMHEVYNIYRKEMVTDPWELVGTTSGRVLSYRDMTGKFETEMSLYAITSVTRAGVESELPEGNEVHLFIDALTLDNPAPVANLTITERLDRRHEIAFEYDDPPIDFDSFEVYVSQGIVFDDANKSLVAKNWKSPKLTTDAMLATGEYTVAVFAKDTFENLSLATTKSVNVVALPGPSNLRASNLVAGVQLTWDEANTDATLFYDIRVGESFETSVEVTTKHRSTTLFVPIEDANEHTFFVRSVDAFGNFSDEVIQISASVVAPSNVSGFNVVSQDDHIFGTWTELTGHGVIGVIYEIREGQVWETGNLVSRVSGNSFKKLWPEDGNFNFMIKAVSSVKLYSDKERHATTRIAKLQNRDLISEYDFFGDGWQGVKRNTSIFNLSGDNVLRLDKKNGVNRSFGYYSHHIDLNEELYCRNWIVSRAGTEVSASETWDQATYTWDSVEALRSWLPINELDSENTRRLIFKSLKAEDLPSNLIEGFSLNGDLVGLNGTNPDVSTNVSYLDGRYNDGCYGNNTELEYSLAGTDQFTWIFDWTVTSLLSGEIVIGEYGNSANSDWYVVKYDFTTNVFSLVANGVTLSTSSISVEANQTYQICVSQSATDRLLAVQHPDSGVLSTSGSHSAILNTPDKLVALNNVGQTEVGVIGNVEILSNSIELVEFEQRFSDIYPTPVGYEDSVPLTPGDYRYKEAIIVLHIQPSNDNDEFYITNAKLTVDVPEIIDKGFSAVSASGWTTVSYNKSYSKVEFVNALTKSSTELAIAEIEDGSINETTFRVRLKSVSSQLQIAGTISWTSIGR